VYFLETEIEQKDLARTNRVLPFQSQSYVTTDGQAASLSLCQAPYVAQD
jgi:hypothetical protein